MTDPKESQQHLRTGRFFGGAADSPHYPLVQAIIRIAERKLREDPGGSDRRLNNGEHERQDGAP